MRKLCVFAAAVLAMFVAGCAPQLSNNPVQEVNNLPAVRGQMLQLVNQSRRENGAPPLRYNTTLNAAAQAHAEDMARRGFYNHRSPEGRDVADRWASKGGGRWEAIGENILYCNRCAAPSQQAREFHQKWLQSPGHRRNIMRSDFQEFGFGMATANGRTYAVQNFLRQRQTGRW